MQNHHTFLRCSHRTAFFFLLSITLLFVLVGCAALLRSAGLDQDQAAQQSAALERALNHGLAAAVDEIKTGLAEGHSPSTIALNATSQMIWKLIAAGSSTAGVVLSSLLAKWLGTEKKIAKAMIDGIEESEGIDVKSTVHKKAVEAGVEPALAARVRAYT